MSSYNVKNYIEQGSNAIHIGGKVIFDYGFSFENGCIYNVPASSATTLEELTESFNDLLYALKMNGFMTKDHLPLRLTSKLSSDNPKFEGLIYNNSQVEIEEIGYAEVAITLKCKVEDLRDWSHPFKKMGTHKWLGIGVHAGDDPYKIFVNEMMPSYKDYQEAQSLGLEDDFFVLWIKADEVVRGKNRAFVIEHSDYRRTFLRFYIYEPEEG